MENFLVATFGGTGAFLVQVILTLVVVVALIGVVVWVVRTFSATRVALGDHHQRAPRLSIVDALELDGKRRLILVRRDQFEHLILVGGPSDLVVEQTIYRGVPLSNYPKNEGIGRPAAPPPTTETVPPGRPPGRIASAEEVVAAPVAGAVRLDPAMPVTPPPAAPPAPPVPPASQSREAQAPPPRPERSPPWPRSRTESDPQAQAGFGVGSVTRRAATPATPAAPMAAPPPVAGDYRAFRGTTIPAPNAVGSAALQAEPDRPADPLPETPVKVEGASDSPGPAASMPNGVPPAAAAAPESAPKPDSVPKATTERAAILEQEMARLLGEISTRRSK